MGGNKKIESHLSVQKVPAVLLFDLLQSSLDHTLEMMLVGEVYFLFAQTCFLAALYELSFLIPNPLVNWMCGLLCSPFTSVREIK